MSKNIVYPGIESLAIEHRELIAVHEINKKLVDHGITVHALPDEQNVYVQRRPSNSHCFYAFLRFNRDLKGMARFVPHGLLRVHFGDVTSFLADKFLQDFST